MAWETVCLLPPLVLVLLASGSRGQSELKKLEGESLSVKCRESIYQTKFLCKVQALHCIILVSSPRSRAQSRFSIHDSDSGYFSVTMTALRVEDTGLYCCGTYQNPCLPDVRCFHLVVSRASTLRTTRSSRTTGWTSDPQPASDSPAGDWTLTLSLSISGAAFLLVGSVLLTLCYRKAQRRASQGKDEPHIDSDLNSLEGKDLQPGSAEDSGAISYASITHLHVLDSQGSIYVNTHPNFKLVPDPLLSVEYASISEKRSPPPKSVVQQGRPGPEAE